MRILIQRVRHACVQVEERTIGRIEKGLLLLVGIHNTDTMADVEALWHRIQNLRIFDDDEGKTNVSLRDAQAELLIVSQFTLYGDCRKGNRPSFTQSAPPQLGRCLYEAFVRCAAESFPVQTGEFGAHMEVDLCNDGPFTLLLETRDGKLCSP